MNLHLSGGHLVQQTNVLLYVMQVLLQRFDFASIWSEKQVFIQEGCCICSPLVQVALNLGTLVNRVASCPQFVYESLVANSVALAPSFSNPRGAFPGARRHVETTPLASHLARNTSKIAEPP